MVQLRQDNLAASHFSLVGFQTQLKWGEQKRVFRMIPGLESAEFVRYGMIHRNTYVNAPAGLEPTFETRRRPGLFFAGQMSGVEGYVESAASGLIAGIAAAARARGEEPRGLPRRRRPSGALGRYIAESDPEALPAHQHRLRPAARPADQDPRQAPAAGSPSRIAPSTGLERVRPARLGAGEHPRPAARCLG